mgnify:CR=1 FL=1
MLVKVMSAENLADSDPRKTHTLHAGVRSYTLLREGRAVNGTGAPEVHLTMEGGGLVILPAPGNVYAMNAEGQTIAAWSPESIGTAGEPARYQ